MVKAAPMVWPVPGVPSLMSKAVQKLERDPGVLKGSLKRHAAWAERGSNPAKKKARIMGKSKLNRFINYSQSVLN